MASGASALATREPPAGRPSRLERIPPKVRALILERIAVGVPMVQAAISCGVPRRTFQRWLDLGRADDAKEPYRRFAAEVDQALAQFAVDGIIEVSEHGAKDWRAKAYLLDHGVREFVEQDLAKRTGGQVSVQVNIALERRQAAEEILLVASRALADDPEALERLTAALRSAGGEVVEGEARELPEAAG